MSIIRKKTHHIESEIKQKLFRRGYFRFLYFYFFFRHRTRNLGNTLESATTAAIGHKLTDLIKIYIHSKSEREREEKKKQIYKLFKYTKRVLVTAIHKYHCACIRKHVFGYFYWLIWCDER